MVNDKKLVSLTVNLTEEVFDLTEDIPFTVD